MRVLRGITWDHPRGFDCLAGALPEFHRDHPDIKVTWTKRSLRDFGEAPIDDLAEKFDLIVVDHPFCGRAAATGCLLNLEPLLGKPAIDAFVADAVGPSAISYHYKDGVWALPTDAAAQVCSYRPDLLEAIGMEVPSTWQEVVTLARVAREAGKWVMLPAVPIDAICSFLTLTANLGHALKDDDVDFIETAVVEHALAMLGEIIAIAHPASLKLNPIQAYELMTNSDDIVYVPLAFGYSNYARGEGSPRLRFGNIAGPGKDPSAGSILGGAGCAITKACEHVSAAITYLQYVHAPSHQRGLYFDCGGQPGSRSAWTDSRTNASCANFFKDTLGTLDKAYLRPRFDGFIPFFEDAGRTINSFLRNDISARSTVQRLRSSYEGARIQ